MPSRIAPAFGQRAQNVIGLDPGLYNLALAEVFLGVVEGFQNHVFDLIVSEAVGWFDFDLGLLPAALLPGRNMKDAVGINQELNLDAWQAGRHGRNAFQVETGERAAILRQLALPLQYMDG